MRDRLTMLYRTAPRLPIDDASRIVLFSDCHRGDGSWADDFARNQNLYMHALSHYYTRGFTYIELGDGDELWENKRLSQIVEIHSEVFLLLSRFYRAGRLHMLYGNHDMVKRKVCTCDCMHTYFDPYENRRKLLCPELKFHEALVLRHTRTGREILLVHGHQVDFLNYNLWKLARFLVRYLWRPVELLGVKDPTNAARNYRRRESVERKLIDWVEKKGVMLVAGHTHRPTLPDEGEPPYFNDGSCVHPRCITCIELEHGGASLVKWETKSRRDGSLYVGRVVIEGPRRV